MKIEVKTKNVKKKKRIRTFIDRKIHAVLDRMDSRIKNVSVRLDDQSKTSSEFIGDCRIDVDLFNRRRVHVAAKGESVFECIMNAIRKVEQAVKHELDRSRSAANVRHQQNKRSFVEYVEEVSAADFATTE